MTVKGNDETESKSFRELQDEVDALIAKLEDGELSPDEAVSCYEQATAVIGQLTRQLKRAENTIRSLQDEEPAETKEMA